MPDNLRVAVAGAMGRMGTTARDALLRTGEYCCGLARRADAPRGIVDSIDAMIAQRPEVMLDLTTQPSSAQISLAVAERGVPVVIGASGWTQDDRAALDAAATRRGIGALLVPNFSIGAMLMMRFAQEAARYFSDAEIVEMHHAAKKDKPSGTAQETAKRMVGHGAHVPPIHSLRLPGAVAHQEVVFGGTGELLTIRHDSISRESFVAGMMAAVHGVRNLRGLHVGLEAVLP